MNRLFSLIAIVLVIGLSAFAPQQTASDTTKAELAVFIPQTAAESEIISALDQAKINYMAEHMTVQEYESALLKMDCSGWSQPTQGSGVWKNTCVEGNGSVVTTYTAVIVNGSPVVVQTETCTIFGCTTSGGGGPQS